MANSLTVFCRFHIYWPVDVLMGLLDMAGECYGQPVVRGVQRSGNGALDVRLGTNLVGWKSADDPLVDARERVCELRRDPVDRAPDRLLYQRQPFRTSPLARTLLTSMQTWNFAHFPISGNGAFDKFGEPYDVSRILTPKNTLNTTAYDEYSPLYLPIRFAFVYLLAFAMLTSVLVHAGLHHGSTIYNAVLGRKGEEDDIHQKLMEAYPEVPGWIYAALGVIALSLSIVTTRVWDTGTPLWVTAVAVMLPVIYILPTTFLYANTGIMVCYCPFRVAECLLTHPT